MSLFSTEERPKTSGSGLPRVLATLLVLGALGGGAFLLLRSSGGEAPAGNASSSPAATPTPRTGSLRITADAEGAEVRLDGERLGLAPQTATGLEPGRYRVTLERFGRHPWEREVEIRAGEETRVRARLELTAEAREAARAGKRPALRVVSDVPGASVFLDREFVGETPVEVASLEPGPHRLNVSAEGYEMHAEEVEGGAGPLLVEVAFKDVRLSQRVEVKHKRMFGSNEGTLSASPQGLRFESEKPEDSFQVAFDRLERFEVDYLKDNLEVKIRGGRTYNFTSRSGDPDELFVFHREVEKARTRLGSSASP